MATTNQGFNDVALLIGNPRPFTEKASALRAVAQDFYELQRFLHDVGVHVDLERAVLDSSVSRASVLLRLRTFFQQDATNYFLAVSCHGHPRDGAWMMQGGSVDFEDVVCIWLEVRGCLDTTRSLFILCDSCYSGHWTVKAARLRFPDIAIQSSCAENRTAFDTYKKTFTRFWITKQRKPDLLLPCLLRLKRPCFYNPSNSDRPHIKDRRLEFLGKSVPGMALCQAHRIGLARIVKTAGPRGSRCLRSLCDTKIYTARQGAPTHADISSHFWRLRAVIAEIGTESPSAGVLKRKESHLLGKRINVLFQDVKEHIAESRIQDADQLRIIDLGKMIIEDDDLEDIVPDLRLLFKAQRFFEYFYNGQFKEAALHMKECLQVFDAKRSKFQCQCTIEAVLLAWLSAAYRNLARQATDQEVRHEYVRSAWDLACRMSEVAQHAVIDNTIAVELAIARGRILVEAVENDCTDLIHQVLGLSGDTKDDRRREVLNAALPDLEQALSKATLANWDVVSARMMLPLLRLRVSTAVDSNELMRALRFLHNPPPELIMSKQFGEHRDRLLSMVSLRLGELTGSSCNFAVDCVASEQTSSLNEESRSSRRGSSDSDFILLASQCDEEEYTRKESGLSEEHTRKESDLSEEYARKESDLSDESIGERSGSSWAILHKPSTDASDFN